MGKRINVQTISTVQLSEGAKFSYFTWHKVAQYRKDLGGGYFSLLK